MKKLLSLLFVFTFLFSSSVFAHVSNEKTIYDDIEFSEAKEEIVYLRGLDVIAHERGAHLFKPQEKLSKAELAFWTATFHKLGEHGAAKEDLQKAAVDKGYMDSLEGNATYANVNHAYFGGKAAVENLEAEMTKEEFSLFMGKFLSEKVEGKTLFEMVGYEPGPAGIIEKVSFEMEGEGDQAYKVFRYTIGGKEYQVSKHPKILYGPVDLGVWEGKEIKESWLAPGHGDAKEVTIIQVKEGEFTEDEIVDEKAAPHGNQQNQKENHDQAAQEQSEKGFPVVPVVGGIVLVGIIGWLFMKKK